MLYTDFTQNPQNVILSINMAKLCKFKVTQPSGLCNLWAVFIYRPRTKRQAPVERQGAFFMPAKGGGIR